jgi:hypothetical protein
MAPSPAGPRHTRPRSWPRQVEQAQHAQHWLSSPGGGRLTACNSGGRRTITRDAKHKTIKPSEPTLPREVTVPPRLLGVARRARLVGLAGGLQNLGGSLGRLLPAEFERSDLRRIAGKGRPRLPLAEVAR